MLPQHSQEAANFFNENWQDYKTFVMENRMCHQEMFSVLNQFLHENMIKRSFSFVDVGCGDSSMIYPVLLDNPINKYIGIDIAEKVLKMAHTNLASLNCEKKFIFDNMTNAIKSLQFPVDIIFSSHAIHHLTNQEKIDFIHSCKTKLVPGGFLVMIDGILEENQTRDQLLELVGKTYKEVYPKITSNELTRLLNHHRNTIFPERIDTFAEISRMSGWKGFRVLFRIESLAFMLFCKSECLIKTIKLKNSSF